MRFPLVPLFPGRTTSVARGDNCSTDPAPVLLHCPALCLLQLLALVPLHICSVLPTARLRGTSAFWPWGGFLHGSAPKEGRGRGCWPGSSELQSHRAGSHPCWLLSMQEPLRSSLPSAPLRGAAPHSVPALQALPRCCTPQSWGSLLPHSIHRDAATTLSCPALTLPCPKGGISTDSTGFYSSQRVCNSPSAG